MELTNIDREPLPENPSLEDVLKDELLYCVKQRAAYEEGLSYWKKKGDEIHGYLRLANTKTQN